MGNPKLLVGTSKGLLVWENTNGSWQIGQALFQGMPVTTTYVDPRNGAWWLGISHRHWGPKLHVSRDAGTSWEVISSPTYPQDTLSQSGKPFSLKKIWSIQQAGPDKQQGIWLGTEPGGLFYSSDYGSHFELNMGLWRHPTRMDPTQWFGAGRDHPFIHSIEIHPKDSNHVFVAVSCAGVFETKDGGVSWTPRNAGLKAFYLPDPNVDVGHDPHRLLICEANPQVIWQQNHCGIFRTENGGEFWDDVTDKNGVANYGFGLAIDHKNPQRAWVIPAKSDEERVPNGLALCVCRTEDGGKTWQTLTEGLPQSHCFDIVFRHSFVCQGERLAFGTTNGNLYLSENGGDSWSCLSHTLSRIESLAFI